MPTRLRPLVVGAGWGVADQALSSLTNFGVGILAARELGLESFGVFSVAFATYTLLLGASRSICSEPLTVRYSHTGDPEFSVAVERSTGLSLLTGLAATGGCIAASTVLSDELGAAFLVLAVIFPGLLIQDHWRFTLFAADRGRSAFINDSVWALILFPSLGWIIATGRASTSAFLLAWGASAACAALLGIIQLRTLPKPLGSWAWLREHSDLAPRFAGEFAGSSALSQVTIYLIGGIAGLATLGTIRAAQILLGPMTVLFQGLRLFAVPEAVRQARTSELLLRRFCSSVGLAMLAGAGLWGGGIWAMSESVGLWVLQDAWNPARDIVLVLALAAAGSAVSSAAAIGLRALAAAKRSLRATWLAGVLTVVGGAVGAWLGDATGAAWGIAGSAWAASGFWWLHLSRGLTEIEQVTSGAADSFSHRPDVTDA